MTFGYIAAALPPPFPPSQAGEGREGALQAAGRKSEAIVVA